MDVTIGQIPLKNCEVEIILERYASRHSSEYIDGDDMVDMGRKSYEFNITGQITFDQFKVLNEEVRTKKGNVINLPLGNFKIVVKKLQYKTSGEFLLNVIEDVV